MEVLSIEEADRWDNIVRSFAHYDTYWLSGYVKAFQIHGDGEPLLFYYDKNGTKGILVVMKRDVSKDKHFAGKIQGGKYFDFATPYGYGGWLIEGEDISSLLSEYDAWCKENLIISEFVRFHPVLENHVPVDSFYEVIRLGKVVTMDISDRDVIWANIPSKNRNMIRKAQKNGVTVRREKSSEIMNTFRQIYNGTMDKDEADAYYYFEPEFYESILSDLRDSAEIFSAWYNGKIIAASIMLLSNRRINYHLSGSLREYSSLAATNLILFETANWGADNGYETLYLGGGVGSGEDSLFKFKKAFYRPDDDKYFHIGKKIYNRNLYDKLVDMREKTESGFFPKYRA